jgi:hypothetical protein
MRLEMVRVAMVLEVVEQGVRGVTRATVLEAVVRCIPSMAFITVVEVVVRSKVELEQVV